MEMKELDWRAIEQAVFEIQRGWGLFLEQNTADELKAMEHQIYIMWSRMKRVVEMKELIEHEMKNFIEVWEEE